MNMHRSEILTQGSYLPPSLLSPRRRATVIAKVSLQDMITSLPEKRTDVSDTLSANIKGKGSSGRISDPHYATKERRQEKRDDRAPPLHRSPVPHTNSLVITKDKCNKNAKKKKKSLRSGVDKKDRTSSLLTVTRMTCDDGTPRGPPPKFVRFSKNVISRQPSYDLTPTVEADMWFTKKEELENEQGNSFVVHKMENGEKARKDTTRGLENRTEEGKWRVYKNTRDAWNTVLDEQDRQKREGVSDLECIAKLYFKETIQSRKEAWLRGVKDAKAVSKYHKK